MASPAANCSRILITGPPGVGKTTLVRRVRDELVKSGVVTVTVGFYTEEVRDESRERIGFNVLSFADGRQAAMARVSIGVQPGMNRGGGSGGQRQPTVGKYGVNVAAFEDVALTSLAAADSGPEGKTVVIIDEIGKMELFSHPFVARIRQLFGLEGSVTSGSSGSSTAGSRSCRGTKHVLLATVPSLRGAGIPLVEELKSLPGVRLVTVSKENRLQMAASVAQQIRAILASSAL